MPHAESYNDPGTPEEQSRRTFMVNAVLALGGVISLGLVVPLLVSLVPSADAAGNEWSPIAPDEWNKLQKATDKPIKITFNLHEVDGYLPPADEQQFVWAVKASDADFRAKRPELFTGDDEDHVSGRLHGLHDLQPDLPASRLPLLVGRRAE